MNKEQAKTKLRFYLRGRPYRYYADKVNGVDRFTMTYKGYENSPDNSMEGSFYFYSECMEIHIYYSDSGSKLCRESTHKNSLMRLLNYINATLWSVGVNGHSNDMYKTTHCCSPRIYMAEDDTYDIVMTATIPYVFYEYTYFVEDFFIVSITKLLDSLAPAIFQLLSGKKSLKEAKRMVDSIPQLTYYTEMFQTEDTQELKKGEKNTKPIDIMKIDFSEYLGIHKKRK